MRIKLFVISSLISSLCFGQLPQKEVYSLVGFFGEFKLNESSISMSQENNQSNFQESSEAFCRSYKGVLGYAMSAQLSPYLFADLGGGLSYSYSDLNSSDYANQIFEYYPVGDFGRRNDIGLRLHLDLGSLVFAGISGEVGLSTIKFNNSERNSQIVKDFGTYYSVYLRGGVALPLVHVILKMYVQLGGTRHFYNSVKWIDIDKKYKNFSSIETVDTPTYNSVANGILSGEFLTCGFSLTLTLPNNIYNTSY